MSATPLCDAHQFMTLDKTVVPADFARQLETVLRNVLDENHDTPHDYRHKDAGHGIGRCPHAVWYFNNCPNCMMDYITAELERIGREK